jgi:hypothetical protein
VGQGVVSYLCVCGGHSMDQTLIIRGRYAGRTFIPADPLPDTEGTAELIILPTSAHARGSIADAFGNAPVLRSGAEILAQVQAERNEWGDR